MRNIRRRTQLVTVAVAVAIFVFGGPRQATQAKPNVDIGTACVMERTPAGNVQTCR